LRSRIERRKKIVASFTELLKEYSDEAARVEAERREKKKLRPVEGHPFWPHEVVRNTIITLVFTAAVFYIAAFLPYYLDTPADARGPPAVILPDWYLLWAFGALKIAEDFVILGRPVPTPFLDAALEPTMNPEDWGPVNAKLVGLIFNALPVVPIVIIPFISRGKSQRPVEQPFWAAAGLAWSIYVLMLSVYSIDVLVNRDFPAFGREYDLWTFFYFLQVNGFAGFYEWLYHVGFWKVPPGFTPTLRDIVTLVRFDLLSWLTHLIPLVTFFAVYIPLWVVKKKHGYEAKLNANYHKVR
jgi:quinol-cytochrome oxidoreductase complex cytochrome b subunit